MDLPIRPVTVAEHAAAAAQRTAETGEAQSNPHEPGTDAFSRWRATYTRALQLYAVPQGEASA